MFTVINSVSSSVTKKLEDKEKAKILTEYNKALNTMKIDKFLTIDPKHQANIALYSKATQYLMSNYTQKKSLAEIEANIHKYRFLEYRDALFNIARRSMDEQENYIKARKFLNIARQKNFICNTLYELEQKLENEWIPK
ncbi:hypothetical protein CWI42_030800 [Ordospora colligata]|uniref:Uncharacterized protein n=1 Tax=Ordospora colligata OC4 TaxID=1354746 RepID=A0A0B2UM59_9MICR|nr:uncharacterized protein M896_030510 [Ordospora colligata OC4]KHN70065.1 hypothetical protein M896_030510 [Ordospora colligata OC4]TBU16632.1 hypothetical protein CWI40_030870 [Ordospora colligata]TBU19205.1 hypothetical protein CWI42_030800 [Ordospora colligata]